MRSQFQLVFLLAALIVVASKATDPGIADVKENEILKDDEAKLVKPKALDPRFNKMIHLPPKDNHEKKSSKSNEKAHDESTLCKLNNILF
jgi:hypothetical protein